MRRWLSLVRTTGIVVLSHPPVCADAMRGRRRTSGVPATPPYDGTKRARPPVKFSMQTQLLQMQQ
jgi:hypothetical protein